MPGHLLGTVRSPLSGMRVLAGDIGGTNTRLRIAECGRGRHHAVRDQHFDSGAYDSLTSVLREFLKQEANRAIDAVCLAIAGPVGTGAAGQSVQVTNLPWEVRSAELVDEFAFPRVRLINDFEAVGYGIGALGRKDFIVLQSGDPNPHAPCAVVGAGTGLGQAMLVWQGDHYVPIATEGGHADFGPTNELQIELASRLLATLGRCSCEDVVSARGLSHIYDFLKGRGGVRESPGAAADTKHGDRAPAITRAALEYNDPLAGEALTLFVDIYGAHAGNVALTTGARGGVYVAGGIAPKILPRLRDGRFIRAFLDKGTMSRYLAAIPVRVVSNPDVGLIGATMAACRLGKNDSAS
ncbi:MAG: glucokinase [Arenicellales bacterium]